MVREDGMVDAVFLCVPALGYGAFIFRATLGVAGFSTLGRSGSPTPFMVMYPPPL